jgi:hypothetical protein
MYRIMDLLQDIYSNELSSHTSDVLTLKTYRRVFSLEPEGHA